MAARLEETLISVWKQVLAEDATIVMLEDRSFPVQRTSRSRLREVDVEFEGHPLHSVPLGMVALFVHFAFAA